MATIQLLFSTGIPQIDHVLCGLIGLLEAVFPGRIRSYFLMGSYSDGTAVLLSDLDLALIFKETISSDEMLQLKQMLPACIQLSPCPLDVIALSEDVLMRDGVIVLKLAARPIFGADLRPVLPLRPLDRYTRRAMHTPATVFSVMRGHPAWLTAPIDYPDPNGRFYGYDRHHRRIGHGQQQAQGGTTDLVWSVTQIANALIAHQAGQYVATKHDSYLKYRRWINDAWTPLVETVIIQCREVWGYLVPDKADDQALLRLLCQQALEFENYFLSVYKAYLLAELRHPNTAIRTLALRGLGAVVYRDDQSVRSALEEARRNAGDEMDQLIEATLQHYL